MNFFFVMGSDKKVEVWKKGFVVVYTRVFECFLLRSVFLSSTACDDSCEGNCTGEGPKGCTECAKGYVETDEEGCKGGSSYNMGICFNQLRAFYFEFSL